MAMRKRPRRVPGARAGRRPARSAGAARASAEGPSRRHDTFPIVGVGASAGGLQAFIELLRQVPRRVGAALVLIQHLDPHHPSHLVERLARETALPVREVRDRLRLERDHVYVMAPGTLLSLAGGVFRARRRPRSRGWHHPIDRFFESLAATAGDRAVGVVLSGAASDGTLGLRAIKAHGGITFAQDPRSAGSPGMPESAVAAGVADFVLPPARIARELAGLIRSSCVPLAIALKDTEEPLSDSVEFASILAQLRSATGVDFGPYRSSTTRRRILRRMSLLRLDDVEQYARHLTGNADEIDALFDDLLIGTTGFFRQPREREVLVRKVFPRIMKRRVGGAPIRIWVPGCATGEEVYTIAICLWEFLGRRAATVPIQIFGTDVKDSSIRQARAGVYPASATGGVPHDALRRHFTPLPGEPARLQINGDLRAACTFARHDLTSDVPFSNLDLISCRNVLIYFSPTLQAEVVPRLHFGLKPGGLLALGPSEGLGESGRLFTPVDKKHHLFVKADGPGAIRTRASRPGGRSQPAAGRPEPSRVAGGTVQPRIDRLLATEGYPCGVVIDGRLQVVQFHGRTRAYLEPSSGRATLNLLAMARGGLQFALRAALDQADRDRAPVTREHVWFDADAEGRFIALKVVPLRAVRTGGPRYVVLFGEKPAASPRAPAPAAKLPLRRQLALLKEDLAAARAYLRTTAAEHAEASEELQSANEELRSSNEELQSLAEELETAKEELQASNEELATLNEELRARNDDLTESGNELLNLLTSINLPIVMVDADLRVRRFTPVAGRLFELVAGDVGRPLADLTRRIGVPELPALVGEVLARATPRVMDVRDPAGHWRSVSIRPFRAAGNRVAGAAIVLVDIDAMKRALEASETRKGAMHVARKAAEARRGAADAALAAMMAEAAELRRETQLELALYLAVAEQQGLASGREVFVTDVLARICQLVGWDAGEVWIADGGGGETLRWGGCWCDPAGPGAFVAGGRDLRLEPGKDLPGRVWAAGQAMWIADLRSDPTTARRALAVREDLRTAFAFPIRARGEFAGVVSLVSRRVREPDATLAARMERLGHLIGLIVQPTPAELRARETADLYRRLFEDDLTGDFIATPEGRILHCNDAFARMMGYRTPKQVMRARHLSILPDERPDRDLLAELREHGRVEHLERTLTRADGRSITVRERLVALFDPAGRLTRIQGYLIDITSGKEAEGALREISGRLLRLQDDERRRIARDLHDTTAQKIAALSMNLSLLAKPPGVPSARKDLLAESLTLADECGREIRTLAHLLHPPLLNEAGLPVALRWFVEGFRGRSDLQVDFEVTGDVGRLSGEKEVALYRVVQEALTNVYRHANARDARVRLESRPDCVAVEIVDPGHGIARGVLEAVEAGTGPGLGLRSMKDRLGELGGTLEIESSQSGTTVRASLPRGEEVA